MEEVKNAISQMRFPQKLWYLLNLGTDAIIWGGKGRTILLNYRILQNYLQCHQSIFKTTHISSFIRQLNLYGFRKVTSHLQDPLCNSSNPYMHEFIHDNFQYGRPELLNKITRKALTMKKGFRPKIYTDNLTYMSPLQKARRALHLAIQKASQDLLDLSTPTSNFKSKYDDAPDDYADKENIEFDWHITRNTDENGSANELPEPDPTPVVKAENIAEFGNMPQVNLTTYMEEACPQNNNFPQQFLSMPDLDEPNNETSGVELLAEFNIGSEVDQGIVRKSNEKESECNSLNCVLPSVSNEHNMDDISMLEKNNDDINHYNSEWDQMFNDMMSNKSCSQEGVSNLRELYSQISQTIDLLNS